MNIKNPHLTQNKNIWMVLHTQEPEKKWKKISRDFIQIMKRTNRS